MPGPSHDMPLQVVDLLPALPTCVDHQSKAAIRIRLAPFLLGQAWGQHHHAPHQTLMLIFQLGHGNDVLFGHQQEMHGRPRMDVVKSQQFVVFVDLATRNGPGNDLAKNAVGVGVESS